MPYNDRRSPRRWAMMAITLLAAMLPCATVRAQSSSVSYHLRQSTLNATGAPAASANFGLTSSGGQESTEATSSSQTFILQSGFWSFLGSGPVPIVLAVKRNISTAENCDLTWSGNESSYEIYSTADCANVFDSFYGGSGNNSADDVVPPVANLVCFNVRSFELGELPTPPPRLEGTSQ